MLKRLVKRICRLEANARYGVEQPADWYSNIYQNNPSHRADYWKSRYYFLWCIIAERLRRDKIRSVLEIGCGAGQLARMLFDNEIIDSYTGLDFSPKAIDVAKENCPFGNFVVGNALTTSLYQQASYDVIICTEVLEHVEQDELIVSQFRGRCICTVPNFPYESHVRHFLTEQEVIDRYGRFFKSLDTWGIKGRGGDSDVVYFLLDGVSAANGGGS